MVDIAGKMWLKQGEPMTSSKTKTCKTCGQTYSIKQFKRRLTLAQTKAFLKQPNATTRYTTTSINCTECRNKKKRTKPLTAKEIRTKISTGDIHPIKGELKLDQIRKAIPLGRSKVMKEYWQKKRSCEFTQTKMALQKQVDQYANRYYSTRSQIKGKTATPKQEARLPQYAYEYQEAKRIRDELVEQRYEGAVDVSLLIKPFKGEA
jgi:hypothetical protein